MRIHLLVRTTLVLLVILVTSLGVSSQSAAPKTAELISVDELKTMMSNNQPLLILDVRGSESYGNSTSRVKGAMHVNVRKLKFRLGFPPLKDVPKDREVVTYCACPSEESAIAAAQILKESGFKRVRALKGGWSEWQKAKGPIEQRPRG